MNRRTAQSVALLWGGTLLVRYVQHLLASDAVEAACFKWLSKQILAWAKLAMMFLKGLDKVFIASGEDLEAEEGVQAVPMRHAVRAHYVFVDIIVLE